MTGGGSACSDDTRYEGQDRAGEETLVHGTCDSCGRILCSQGRWRKMTGRTALTGSDAAATCPECVRIILDQTNGGAKSASATLPGYG